MYPLPAHSDVAVMAVREAPYDSCRNMDIERLAYTYLKRLIALFIFSLTAFLRFNGTLHIAVPDESCHLPADSPCALQLHAEHFTGDS